MFAVWASAVRGGAPTHQKDAGSERKLFAGSLVPFLLARLQFASTIVRLKTTRKRSSNSRGKRHVFNVRLIKQRIGNVWESFGNCLGAFGNAWERMVTAWNSIVTTWEMLVYCAFSPLTLPGLPPRKSTKNTKARRRCDRNAEGIRHNAETLRVCCMFHPWLGTPDQAPLARRGS